MIGQQDSFYPSWISHAVCNCSCICIHFHNGGVGHELLELCEELTLTEIKHNLLSKYYDGGFNPPEDFEIPS